jgi:hypothetical protein
LKARFSFDRLGRAVPALLLLPFLAGFSDEAGLDASYSVSIAGLPIGRFELAVQVTGKAYRLSGTGRVTGLARLFSSSHGAAESDGVLRDGKVVPAHYSYWERGSKSLAIDMDVTGGDVRRLSVMPPVDPAPDRVPVTELHKRGVLDPMSALLLPVRGNGPPLSPAACARTLAVFDGRQRFDIALSYAGLREVRTPRGYRGPVAVCRAAYRPIAGHRAAKKEVRQVEANRSIEAWLAPIEGTRMLLPYRISIRTVLGEGVIEADRFETRPGPRQASSH